MNWNTHNSRLKTMIHHRVSAIVSQSKNRSVLKTKRMTTDYSLEDARFRHSLSPSDRSNLPSTIWTENWQKPRASQYPVSSIQLPCTRRSCCEYWFVIRTYLLLKRSPCPISATLLVYCNTRFIFIEIGLSFHHGELLFIVAVGFFLLVPVWDISPSCCCIHPIHNSLSLFIFLCSLFIFLCLIIAWLYSHLLVLQCLQLPWFGWRICLLCNSFQVQKEIQVRLFPFLQEH